jgi:mono/diheme cytochrome c family protein
VGENARWRIVSELALALAALSACAPLPHSRSAGAITVLAVRPVPWNPANASVGTVRGVADAGDVVCVFADEGTSVFSATSFVARDDAAKGFVDGGAILASDGQARWIVGIDPKGSLWRLRGMTTFENVGARYGLSGKRFFAAVRVDAGVVGFALERELAVARQQETSVFPATTFRHLAGGGGFVAGVVQDEIDLVNTTNGSVTRFSLPGVSEAVLDGKGRLFATTKRAIYAAELDGSLSLLYDAATEDIHGLVVSGDRVWFADGAEIGTLAHGRVSETIGLGIARDASLKPSPSGDVWVVGRGTLQRFEALDGDKPETALGASATNTSSWSRQIQPIFARSCSKCHLASGISGTDLSTERAWNEKKAGIRARVLTDKTMPPEGHPLTDTDRAAIRAWLDAK